MSRSGSRNPSFFQLLFSSLRLEPYFESDFAKRVENLDFRIDMITFLTFVRDNKIIGTQSTGNMPLKMVRELTANFKNPPVLDREVAGHTFRIRSEEDVWQLFYLHVLGEIGGLIKTPRGKQWRLTATGKKFLQSPPLIQLWYLLMTWWHRVNWLLAFPMRGMGETLPPYFNIHTINILQILEVNKWINFEEFADELIQNSGLTWTSQDTTFHAEILRTSVEKMVINILIDFGMVEPDYREKSLGKGTTKELVAFKFNDLGRLYLEAMIIFSLN